MKKVLLVIAAVAMMLVGCSNDNVQVNIYEYHVADADWTPFYECHYVKIKVPQITQDVIEHGIVQMSRFYEQDGTVYYVPLPSTVTEVTDNGDFITTLIDYDYTVGEVCIYVTCSDQSVTDSPGEYDFRVAITR